MEGKEDQNVVRNVDPIGDCVNVPQHANRVKSIIARVATVLAISLVREDLLNVGVSVSVALEEVIEEVLDEVIEEVLEENRERYED